jgi:hypothetical protein
MVDSLKRMSVLARLVLEKTKTIWECQIVSAFPVSHKAYKKMVDISGRAEFPPFELSP